MRTRDVRCDATRVRAPPRMPTFSPARRVIADRSPGFTPPPKQVAAARLDALENDNADAEGGGSDDSEYEIEEGEGANDGRVTIERASAPSLNLSPHPSPRLRATRRRFPRARADARFRDAEITRFAPTRTLKSRAPPERTTHDAGVGKVLKRKKSGGTGRTTRGAKQSKKGARSFAGLLDEAMLDRVPPEVPTYATAAAPPPRATAPRKFCSVCGFQSCYNCARCGMRFCSRKCNAVHTETRCLKFTA